MIYPRNFEQKIGFENIRQMIHENCLSSMGSSYVEKIRFTLNFELLNKLHQQVDEFRQILLLINKKSRINGIKPQSRTLDSYCQ